MIRMHTRYYAEHFMSRIVDLQFMVIGLGMAMLAINYLEMITGNHQVLGLHQFWQRIVFLLLVITFTSYTAIIYNAYPLRFADSGEPLRNLKGSMSLFALFLLDILQVTLTACMFGIFFIPDAQLQVSEAGSREALVEVLSFSKSIPVMLFIFGALWHAVVGAWYTLAQDKICQSTKTHLSFLLVYTLVAGILALLPAESLGTGPVPNIVYWLLACLFGTILVVLFRKQGAFWLESAETADGE